MADSEKTAILVRLFNGDAHAGIQLRAAVRAGLAPEIGEIPPAPRTVGELRARADAIRSERERAEAEAAAAERQRRAVEAEKARQARLDALARRGKKVWDEINSEIERRNAAGYDKTAGLLADLRAIAEQREATADFARRLRAIRERHAGKPRFMERLKGLE